MNNLLRFRHKDLVREEAALWVVRIKEGLAPEQEPELDAWLRKHRDHGTALVEVATAWDELDLIAQLAPPIHASGSFADRRARARTPLAYVLVAALVVLVGWFGYARHSIQTAGTQREAQSRPQGSVFETAVGEQSKVRLSDGSTASLNTNSGMLVDFSGTDRKIELRRGEAHFSVEPDDKRPFVVLARDIAVRALGTAFNVSLTNVDEPEVVVTAGRVSVLSHRRGRDATSTSPTYGKAIELSAGDIATFKEAGQSISRVDEKSLDNRMAWTSGMMVFVDEPLEQVIAELGRYTTTKVMLGDPALKQISVAGYFRVGDVDALLFALAANFGISWHRQQQDRIILTAGPDHPVD